VWIKFIGKTITGMKFDTIIIGGGLSGLTCGIKLVEKGQKCLIVSSGQSALHFSSGSFDLLNHWDGKPVIEPLQAIAALTNSKPQHPYAKIGVTNFGILTQEAKALLQRTGVATVGNANCNHYRITPLGELKPTWLSVPDCAISPDGNTLPWKKVSIFNIAGFLDFHPTFISEAFQKMGTLSEIYTIDIPELESLRRNPSELRATNISQLFENDAAFASLAEILKQGRNHSDIIIIPACLGLNDNSIVKLNTLAGCPVYMIPTFPPSIVGIRSQQRMITYFQQQGGYYMLGDAVNNIGRETNGMYRINTNNHGDISFTARNIVLATGSFFSKGLVASRQQIVEPIAYLDVDAADKRQDWYSENFFDDQAYQYFGVSTDANFRVSKQGNILNRFYAAGAVLSGFNALKEGCGSGVSLLTALHIANQIIKNDPS
jgi:glycerol-3-phosphate dehydrogenase subunit B